jgi:hypothetical protein
MVVEPPKRSAQEEKMIDRGEGGEGGRGRGREGIQISPRLPLNNHERVYSRSGQEGRMIREKGGREEGREGGREEGSNIYIYVYRYIYKFHRGCPSTTKGGRATKKVRPRGTDGISL